MNGTGKIARLPHHIREELNRRLLEGQPGKVILEWLNQQPEVQAILKAQFGGRRINHPNLSEWKARGFREWQLRRETLAQAREICGPANELESTDQCRFTDNLANLIAAHYAVLMAGWNGEVTEAFRFKLRALHALSHDIANLRRGDHRIARLEFNRERREMQSNAAERELLEFLKQLPPTFKPI